MSRFFKRWWWALLSVAVGVGLARLHFDVDVLNLLPPDEPTVQGLKLYEQHFADARELIITLRAPEAEQAEGLAGALAARLRQQTNLVAGVSWQPPWMEDPAQMGELLGCLWINQPPEAFRALQGRLAPAQLKSVLDQTKEILTTSMSPMDMARRAFDPFDLLSLPALTNLSGFSMEQNLFVSPEGTFRLVYVQANVDLGSYRSCERWLQAIGGVVADLRTRQPKDWEGVVVRYTGRPVFVAEIASSMQHDLSGSVVGTSAIIALLFWLTHRRWLPMFWLLTLLSLILMATLALGGLVLGAISVVSMGFAAVLLGLAVDYAVVHYQEALAHPDLSVPEIRRAIAPSILWAAITTMSAFLVLNLGGLPGLAQLGTLVAIGVGVAAWVMVMIYLPPLFPERRQAGAKLAPVPWWKYFIPPDERSAKDEGRRANQDADPLALRTSHFALQRPWLWTALILLTACLVLCVKRPGLDRSGNALRPQHLAAETTLDEIKAEMKLPPDPLWLVIAGKQEPDVYQRLTAAEGLLASAVSNHLIGEYLLPSALWPRAEFQAVNRARAAELATQGPLLREAALREGFNTNALMLTEQMLATWARAGASTGVVWPTNQASQWLLKRFVARTTGQLFVMGLVYPATNQVAGGVRPSLGAAASESSAARERSKASVTPEHAAPEDGRTPIPASALADLSTQLATDGALLSSWELLGSTTLKRVQSHLWQLVTPMVVLVLASLWLAFRRPTEILLGAGVLSLSGLALLAIMTVAGWSWNLLNLMALPLMLGTGVDYSIFIQLALRRHGGDLELVRRSIGRALMLCGGTAMAGFGSLAWSTNPGMASLGKVCAIGIGANMLIAVFLLPHWWQGVTRGEMPKSEGRRPKEIRSAKSETESDESEVSTHSPTHPLTHSPAPSTPDTRPSSLYRAGLWRCGLALVRVLPTTITKAMCVVVGELYYLVARQRREVVVRNLLPALAGDRPAAERAAHRLHRNFGRKLVDLWRMESGAPVRDWITDPKGLEIIQHALQAAHGVLFITLHLGNWEHGGLLLSQFGIGLTVLSQAEPEDGLTDLRVALRKRCGVETLIIGQDSFAFVEVIRRLETGAALAIALDRPPASNAVPVELFGRPFGAPAAAAELARASGCALIAVTIARRRAGFEVKVLPEFTYDRRALGEREARRQLTQQILRAFEPHIRQDIDQWYQFVPIWPDAEPAQI